MNILKKITAMLLVAIMALTVIGCHPKDELAVTIDGQTYTSGYYMCALVNAYLEAQQKVYENLTDAEKSSTDLDFFKKKIDDKSFTDWTKDRAIESLKEISHYKTLCKENKLEISTEELNNAKQYANIYWSSYGYSAIFEPNGVSQETYTNYTVDNSYSGLYFEHLYGKGGDKEIPEEQIKEKLYKDFILANVLEVTFSEETDAQKKEIKEKFETYKKDLEKKSKTFEEIYKDYNKITEEEKKEDTKEEENTESKPLDIYASVLGAEGTGYEHAFYKEINELKVNEIKLIEKENNAGYVLAIKKDIESDPYYLETLDMNIRYLLKNDEYMENMKKEAAKLEADINKYAVNRFKVNKIIEPTY